MKLTRWIGGKHKPVRVGGYDRRFMLSGIVQRYYWDGSKWLWESSYFPGELIRTRVENLPWRGLAEKPNSN